MCAGNYGVRVSKDKSIRAAGCVVYRPRSKAEAGLEYLLIHRPKYGDWSLPKGKLEKGESHREAALREVEEETGFVGSLGMELPPVRYQMGGKDKAVRYWAMEATGGKFVANGEVDRVAWLGVSEATSKLSYEHDAVLVRHVHGSLTMA